MTSAKERLDDVIYLSYKSFCNKIASGLIDIHNEISMQMNFAVILKQVTELFIYSPREQFSIILEKYMSLSKPTAKSQNKIARCDIFIEFTYDKVTYSAAIEMKYFNKGEKSTEAVTDNRFSLIADIENLEEYKNNSSVLTCYQITATNNPNHTIKKKTKFCIAESISGNTYKYSVNSTPVSACILNNYTLNWKQYGENYFVIIKV